MQTRRSFGRNAIAAGLAAIPVVARQAGTQQTPPSGHRFETPEEYEKHPEGSPIPGQKWKVHDLQRPQPAKVTPGLPILSPAPPSDAIVLFDGKDLSQWVTGGRGGTIGEPKWKVETATSKWSHRPAAFRPGRNSAIANFTSNGRRLRSPIPKSIMDKAGGTAGWS